MVKHEYLVLVAILLGCLGLAWGVTAVTKDYLSGGLSAHTPVPDPPSPKYLAFTPLDNGTTAHIHARDIITIRLPENPTTGYRWNITTEPGLRTLDDTYIYSEPSGMMTGAGRIRFLTLEPETTGTEHISAVYKRSWEEATGDMQVFSMTFVVS